LGAKESKRLSDQPNSLEYQRKPAIGGRHILTCLAIFIFEGLVLGPWMLPAPEGKLGLEALAIVFAYGLVAVLLAVLPLGWSAISALGFRFVRWETVGLGVAGALGVSFLVSQFGIESEGMKQVIDITREDGNLMASLTAIAILAPLAEELVFRGLIYGWIENRWSASWAAIVSSILFALAHYEPSHIVLVAPLAALFGWLRYRTDSILPSLAAHLVNNGFAVLAAVYLTSS
jgi:membrane protease YdiL (CAAX protease family)